jgi:hypothetical protein
VHQHHQEQHHQIDSEKAIGALAALRAQARTQTQTLPSVLAVKGKIEPVVEATKERNTVIDSRDAQDTTLIKRKSALAALRAQAQTLDETTESMTLPSVLTVKDKSEPPAIEATKERNTVIDPRHAQVTTLLDHKGALLAIKDKSELAVEATKERNTVIESNHAQGAMMKLN